MSFHNKSSIYASNNEINNFSQKFKEEYTDIENAKFLGDIKKFEETKLHQNLYGFLSKEGSNKFKEMQKEQYKDMTEEEILNIENVDNIGSLIGLLTGDFSTISSILNRDLKKLLSGKLSKEDSIKLIEVIIETSCEFEKSIKDNINPKNSQMIKTSEVLRQFIVRFENYLSEYEINKKLQSEEKNQLPNNDKDNVSELQIQSNEENELFNKNFNNNPKSFLQKSFSSYWTSFISSFSFLISLIGF